MVTRLSRLYFFLGSVSSRRRLGVRANAANLCRLVLLDSLKQASQEQTLSSGLLPCSHDFLDHTSLEARTALSTLWSTNQRDLLVSTRPSRLLKRNFRKRLPQPANHSSHMTCSLKLWETSQRDLLVSTRSSRFSLVASHVCQGNTVHSLAQ